MPLRLTAIVIPVIHSLKVVEFAASHFRVRVFGVVLGESPLTRIPEVIIILPWIVHCCSRLCGKAADARGDQAVKRASDIQECKLRDSREIDCIITLIADYTKTF